MHVYIYIIYEHLLFIYSFKYTIYLNFEYKLRRSLENKEKFE